MRIIKEAFLIEAARNFPKASSYLDTWRRVVKFAVWKNLTELRKTYPSADGVKVKSGRQVTVFNVCGNEFRLIAAVHYDRQVVYTLRFLTHAEYCKDKWKETL